MIKDTVTIDKEEYEELKEAFEWLQCLKTAGVDNWEGISFAHDLLEDTYND